MLCRAFLYVICFCITSCFIFYKWDKLYWLPNLYILFLSAISFLQDYVLDFQGRTANFIYFCWYIVCAWCLIIIQGLTAILTSSSAGSSASASVLMEGLKYFRSPVQMTDLIMLGSILFIYFLCHLYLQLNYLHYFYKSQFQGFEPIFNLLLLMIDDNIYFFHKSFTRYGNSHINNNKRNTAM